MVAIVLGTLKVIGILLLVILGLLLFVLLSVLFVPVRYRAEGSFYGQLKGSASVSWFLHLISLNVSYDGEAQMDLRFLWFHPGRDKSGKDALEQELAERVETAEVSGSGNADRRGKGDGGCEQAGKETAEHPETVEPVRTAEHLETVKAGLKEKIHRIRKSLKAAAKKIRKGKAQWETIQAFIRDEENKKAFGLAKRQIFAIIRHVLPQRLEGKLHFGFDDPYATGQVLTWISPFYGLYGRHVQVTPDFLEPCLDGELKLRGRIRFGTLLFLGFRMLQNKNIRLWMKKWRES